MTRIETGALQINDDWTGLFIRGDDALMLRDVLAVVYRENILEANINAIVYKYIAIIDRHVSHHRRIPRDVQKIETLEEPA